MRYVIFLLTVMALTSFSTAADAQDEVVYVEFTNRTTFADLILIQQQMAEKNITLEYLLIEFDEGNRYMVDGVTYINLKALSFKVNCNDGFEGSGKSLNLVNKAKLSFTRDYRVGAKVPFGINVDHAGK